MRAANSDANDPRITDVPSRPASGGLTAAGRRMVRRLSFHILGGTSSAVKGLEKGCWRSPDNARSTMRRPPGHRGAALLVVKGLRLTEEEARDRFPARRRPAARWRRPTEYLERPRRGTWADPASSAGDGVCVEGETS